MMNDSMNSLVYTIESIEVKPKQLVLVTLSENQIDEEKTISHLIDRKTWEDSGFSKSSALTTDELSALLSLSSYNRSKSRALWLLSRKDYSKKELLKKLKDVADEETNRQVIDRLEELGLLDDEKFSDALARQYCGIRNYPIQQALRKMQEKGIDREQALASLQKNDANDMASALVFLKKKCYTHLLEYEKKQKIIRSLLLKGFRYSSVKEAIAILEESNEESV